MEKGNIIKDKNVILIGLCGKMGSGKNYISETYIMPLLKSQGYIPLEMSLADQIKINVMTKENITYNELYVNKSDKTRTLLQSEGTERGRQCFGDDIWIKYLDNWISIYSKRGIKAFVVPDIRFKNEANWIKQKGGLLIKVVAPNRNEFRLQKESGGDPVVYKRIKLHQSETEIDEIDTGLFDLIINNENDNVTENIDEQILNLLNQHDDKDEFNITKVSKVSKVIVQKYGGTSIGTPEKMKRVVDIIRTSRELGVNKKPNNLYVIVSAISSSKKGSGTTSQLLKCTETLDLSVVKNIINEIETCHGKFADEINNLQLKNWIITQCQEIYSLLQAASIIGELSVRSRDIIISKGETMSSRILTEYLKWSGLDAINIDRIDFEYDSNIIKVLGGYMLDDLTCKGVIETVGRGYSDYTAGVISRDVGAHELQIWKEVDGIYSADPNAVLHAKLLKTISKEEAAQLTYYGCQAINPLTIEIVKCPIRIKNCKNPDGEGTLVIDKNEEDNTTKKTNKPIAVTIKDNISVINISSNKKSVSPEFFADVFGTLKTNGIIVDLVSTSQVDISVAIDSNQKFDQSKLTEQLSRFGTVEFRKDMCVLSLIGQSMKSTVGIAAKMFKVLSRHRINIEMISQGASEINISCVIKKDDSLAALCHVHYDLVV